MMQEPILHEKRQVHFKFCEQAKALIERVIRTKITQDFPKDLTVVSAEKPSPGLSPSIT